MPSGIVSDALALPSVRENSGISIQSAGSMPLSRGSFSIANEGTFFASKPSGINLAMPSPTNTLCLMDTFCVAASANRGKAVSKYIATVLIRVYFMF